MRSVSDQRTVLLSLISRVTAYKGHLRSDTLFAYNATNNCAKMEVMNMRKNFQLAVISFKKIVNREVDICVRYSSYVSIKI